MQSCPVCLAELRPDPDAEVEAIVDILALGGHLFRPDGVPAFSDGPACTLLRLAARGSLAFTGANGLVEAGIDGPGRQAVPPLACRDHDGSVLFSMVVYEASEHALVAVGADGAALAAYLRAGTGIDVRDETSAPVANLRKVRGEFLLVETGGGVLARVGSTDSELEGWVDDQWSLHPEPGVPRLPLRPLAAVALVLAAKVLFGRPWPVRATPGPDGEPDEHQPWPFG